MYTLEEIMEVLKEHDLDTILDIVQPTTDELVEGLGDVIELNFDSIQSDLLEGCIGYRLEVEFGER